MTSQFFKTAEPRLRLALCSAFGRVYALVAAAAALLIALPILVMREQLSIRRSAGPVSSVLLRPDGSSSSAQLRLSVPDSWSTFQDWAVIKEAGTGVAFGSVGNIYTDRCHWSGALLDPRVGPSVDDLAIAVAESWGSDASAPMEVMLDGFAGKQMVLTVPTDVDFADCFLGWFQWGVNDDGGERYYQGPGQIDQRWILDVDGAWLLINATYLPEASPQDRAELQAIVDSIQIETE